MKNRFAFSSSAAKQSPLATRKEPGIGIATAALPLKWPRVLGYREVGNDADAARYRRIHSRI